ncbi:hypothetical protein S40285_09842 [Stachybotrys chlorohalonatus IBT 40285]|uniref:Uncharacterized protein n=1 Tax=Stachybotrys chlorohalonatus (strain IBT 40285) TaxID=1283841 RepID=A0A084QNG4_STAC4|nr:hypothetical protein S40285_09842 [Stachybotrys chlorohalonata IBT 40285]
MYLVAVHANATDGSKRSQNIEGCSQRWRKTYYFYYHICATTVRYFLDAGYHRFPVCRKIKRLSAEGSGNLEAALYTVNSKNMPWTEMESRNNGTKTNWAASHHHHYGLSYILVRTQSECAFDTVVASRENVPHENESTVRYDVRRLDDCAVGVWHAHVFRLAAIQRHGSKDRRCRCQSTIAIRGSLGSSPRHSERGDDPVAYLDGRDGRPSFDNSAGKLMAHYEASSRRLPPAIKVKLTTVYKSDAGFKSA